MNPENLKPTIHDDTDDTDYFDSTVSNRVPNLFMALGYISLSIGVVSSFLQYSPKRNSDESAKKPKSKKK